MGDRGGRGGRSGGRAGGRAGGRGRPVGRGAPYTGPEYTEMIIFYGEAGRNANEAACLYAAALNRRNPPDLRRRPDANVILGAVHRGREDGNLIPLAHRGAGQGVVGAPRVVRNVENEENVLECLEEDPTRSIRNVAGMLNLTYSTIYLISQIQGTV
ncbi:uncharacterized protein LOC131669240 [Phymastichus coffea]|uniref:uncharacterized protein LOC131669240 n=1 Tax=Phymastichus coffea TaxID=108790 RepID=UPI00273B524A|nr:uncharacterized protein LOC131669240 [Phymastichus coffea]